jgi:amino acid permease
MKHHRFEFKKAIIIGSIIPFAVYLLFAVAVVGITGMDTTEVANIGVGRVLGTLPLILINLFAVIAMATSFIALGLGLKEMYQFDYGWKPHWAFSAVITVPIIGGIHSFITILGISGAIAGGLEGILLMLIYWKAKSSGDRAPEYNLPLGLLPVFLLIAVFFIGAIITIKELFL